MSPAIQTDPERLTELAVAGFAGVDAGGVELHLERARPRKPVFVGRAYPQLPSRPRTQDGARYLVRLVLPSLARNRGYPITYRYRGLSTAPWITVRDWRERLVALAAHAPPFRGSGRTLGVTAAPGLARRTARCRGAGAGRRQLTGRRSRGDDAADALRRRMSPPGGEADRSRALFGSYLS